MSSEWNYYLPFVHFKTFLSHYQLRTDLKRTYLQSWTKPLIPIHAKLVLKLVLSQNKRRHHSSPSSMLYTVAKHLLVFCHHTISTLSGGAGYKKQFITRVMQIICYIGKGDFNEFCPRLLVDMPSIYYL